MKNVHMSFKKNQIIIFVIGLMVITAGYLSYSNNSTYLNSVEAGAVIDSEQTASIGDAKLVSANVADVNSINHNMIETENVSDGNNLNENITNNIQVIDNINNETNDKISDKKDSEAIDTSNNVIEGDSYFANSRLERNTMYSQTIETYQKILDNSNVSEAQKKSAEKEITRLNNEQNGIMIAENLIKTKGIEDLVIFVNKNSINVIVKGKEPSKARIAQMQNIITRELEADIADIHIMNKGN